MVVRKEGHLLTSFFFFFLNQSPNLTREVVIHTKETGFQFNIVCKRVCEASVICLAEIMPVLVQKRIRAT